MFVAVCGAAALLGLCLTWQTDFDLRKGGSRDRDKGVESAKSFIGAFTNEIAGHIP